MRIFMYLLMTANLLSFLITPVSIAQPAPAAKTDKPAETPKVVKPMAFWALELPAVNGVFEAKYDINGDSILQTSETKILLRHVQAEILKTSLYNIGDSKLLKAYDKNKDGVLSKLELEAIKKDLSY